MIRLPKIKLTYDNWNPKKVLNKPKKTREGSNKKSSQKITPEQKALSLINQGELEEAEKIYRQLISKGTNNHIVYANLAVLCGKRNNQKERVSLLNKALELNPKHPQTHCNCQTHTSHTHQSK